MRHEKIPGHKLHSYKLVAFSIAIHFTSIHPLYDRYESPSTNNPITIAAIFITFFMAYHATVPNRKPPPAENTRFSIDNYWCPPSESALLSVNPRFFLYSCLDLTNALL